MDFLWYAGLKKETENFFGVKLDDVDKQTKDGINFYRVPNIIKYSKKITGSDFIGKYIVNGVKIK